MTPGSRQFEPIVVGVDGSDGARHALLWAAAFAQASGAQVSAVHVLTYSREFARDLSLDTMRTWRHELAAELNGPWVEPLRQADVHYRTTLIEADSPAVGIVEVVEKEFANLIVLGSSGHGSMASRVLAVTRRSGHHAAPPVVVVPSTWSP